MHLGMARVDSQTIVSRVATHVSRVATHVSRVATHVSRVATHVSRVVVVDLSSVSSVFLRVFWFSSLCKINT